MEPEAGSLVLGYAGGGGGVCVCRRGGGPSALALSPQSWLLGLRVCVCSVCAGLVVVFFFFEGEMGVGLEETFCMSYLVDWILIFYALAVTTLA